jgi:hypothetical protein
MEEARFGWRDLCSQPPTANRFHLTRVGSGPRHDIAVSGRGTIHRALLIIRRARRSHAPTLGHRSAAVRTCW